MSYYKTNDPLVLAAFNKFDVDTDALVARAKAFGDAIGGGRPLYRYSHSSMDFAGLTFNPPKPQPLWTKPDRQSKMQRPRSTITGKDQKQPLLDLQTAWANAEIQHGVSGHDACTVSRNDLWKSMGTDWGAFLFSGIALFKHEGFIWIQTKVKLNDSCVEILGSEYEAADAAHTLAEREAKAKSA